MSKLANAFQFFVCTEYENEKHIKVIIKTGCMLLELLALISGMAILAYCSEQGVSHVAGFAMVTGISNIVVGVVIVSVGTDLPELTNSILLSVMGTAALTLAIP